MGLGSGRVLSLRARGDNRGRTLLAKLIWHLRDHPARLPVILWKNLVHPLTEQWAEEKFDRSLGVDTRRFLGAAELSSPGERAASAVDYDPSPPAVLRRLFDIVGDRAQGFTFVDFGAGKGRVMLLAGAYPFAKVAGVEWSEPLYRAACTNIAKMAARNPALPPMEITCGDAIGYEIPESPCILYFFNPFDHATIRRIAERVRKSHAHRPRKIIIISYSPPEVSQIFDTILWPGAGVSEVPRQRRFRKFEAAIFESPDLAPYPDLLGSKLRAELSFAEGAQDVGPYALLHMEPELFECDYIRNLTSLDKAYEVAEQLHRNGRIAEMIFRQRGDRLEAHTGKSAIQEILRQRDRDLPHLKQ